MVSIRKRMEDLIVEVKQYTGKPWEIGDPAEGPYEREGNLNMAIMNLHNTRMERGPSHPRTKAALKKAVMAAKEFRRVKNKILGPGVRLGPSPSERHKAYAQLGVQGARPLPQVPKDRAETKTHWAQDVRSGRELHPVRGGARKGTP